MRVPRHRLPFVGALLITLSSCAAPSPATSEGGPLGAQRQAAGGAPVPHQASFTADWSDTTAAVLVGSESIEAVVHQTTEVSPTHRRYDLRLITGESATLDITRPAPAPTTPTAAATEPPVELTLTAHVGISGDRVREERLISAVTKRLRELKGVDTAPIR